MFGFGIRGPTDELHPFTKGSETGLGLTIDSTALPRGMRQISIFVYICNDFAIASVRSTEVRCFLGGEHRAVKEMKTTFDKGFSYGDTFASTELSCQMNQLVILEL